jgi:phosphate transport system protein
MRYEYQVDLLEVSLLLVAMAEQARTAMRDATTALLSANAELAEEVLRKDAETDAMHRQVEERVCDLLARQAPVATDLRLLITALHIAADLERMGDLAEHVAKTALRRMPTVAVPEELAPVIRDMASVCDRMAEKIGHVLAASDAHGAAELDRDDDAVDELHRQLFALMLGAAWRHGVEKAVDGALLGRFYERFADHAVKAGQHVVYLVTGYQAST